MSELRGSALAELTAEIISAYVARNALPTAELPALMQSVHDALGRLAGGAPEAQPKAEELKPAVSIKKSVTDDYIVSLENGQKFKSLKRHLMTSYGMTPQQYREKWGLPKDYPMVAPGYAKTRSALAKSLGLGRKPVDAAPPAPAALSEPPPPATTPDTPPPPPRRGRPRKAA